MVPIKNYHFLLLDADGTLLDFGAAMTRAFETTYREAGLSEQRPYSRALLQSYETINDRWWKRFELRECTKPELMRGRFQDFLQENGLSGNPDCINELYFHALGEGGDLLPGALELVRTLARRYELYIVTNGNAPTQKSRLERSGLLPYLRDCFVSETAGAAKPDKRYFDYACARIPSFEPERAVVIGDSLTSDILGAYNAGLDSIWYNPGKLENGRGVPCTYEVGSYEELLALLDA